MKRETCDKILFLIGGVLIGMFFVLTLTSAWFYEIPYSLQFKVYGYTKENALAVCSGKGLERTCYCLNSFTRGIYFYNKSNAEMNLDFNELVSEGGVCSHYTDLYKELSTKLGFKVERESIFVKEKSEYNTYHAFLIIYSNEGYCKLDGKVIDIFIYGK